MNKFEKWLDGDIKITTKLIEDFRQDRAYNSMSCQEERLEVLNKAKQACLEMKEKNREKIENVIDSIYASLAGIILATNPFDKDDIIDDVTDIVEKLEELKTVPISPKT